MKNPDGQIFSMRVDVPIVNLNVNVILDKTHQFVPGLKAGQLPGGGRRRGAAGADACALTQTPITAVMLLEFASNSYAFHPGHAERVGGFFRTLKPDDYIAVVTYDMRTHILTDFTNNKEQVRECAEEPDDSGVL